MVDNFKYQPGGSLPKRIWLNNSDPADGYEGSSIVYVHRTSSVLQFYIAFLTVADIPCFLSVCYPLPYLISCSKSA